MKDLFSVSLQDVMSPALLAVWERMSIGVAIVDADGICVFMNDVQRKVDGFSQTRVVGKHITQLYLPNGMSCVPTIECLRRGEPLLRKAYWYKTVNNSLFSSVSDFIPLFKNRVRDGVLTFTIWMDSTLLTGTGTHSAAGGAARGGQPLAGEKLRYDFASIIGQDTVLRGSIADAQEAAKSTVPVMIWGENGTGKELFAQALHAGSPRRKCPFIAVNCAAIPENLLEGILFGTSRGAYTDATEKPGLFEKADGGTLLLDELNSMPLGLQAKLLRVLQERRVRRLGSSTEKGVDVRVVSILNESPLSAVKRGILRSDLYYRLAVIGIFVPPLRERREDIPLLVSNFLQNSKNAPAGITVAGSVMQMFREYSWPGNVRELQHVIEASLALLKGRSVITEECLPRHFREAAGKEAVTADGAPEPSCGSASPSAGSQETIDDYRDVRRNSVIPLKEKLCAFESRCIRNVLRVTGGNVAKAARIMDLTAPGLRYKMKQLNIGDEDF